MITITTFSALDNATCIKSVGVFCIILKNQDYITSLESCQRIGGDLADVLSEMRTKYLSQHINNTLDNWYKLAYVGLDDIEINNTMVSSTGLPLGCSAYRAWAPGFPKYGNRSSCVVLDSKSLWRTVDCRRKFPALCEYFPEQPKYSSFENLLCYSIQNKSECFFQQLLMNLFPNNL